MKNCIICDKRSLDIFKGEYPLVVTCAYCSPDEIKFRNIIAYLEGQHYDDLVMPKNVKIAPNMVKYLISLSKKDN